MPAPALNVIIKPGPKAGLDLAAAQATAKAVGGVVQYSGMADDLRSWAATDGQTVWYYDASGRETTAPVADFAAGQAAVDAYLAQFASKRNA